MEQLPIAAAVVIALGGLAIIALVLGAPLVRREVVVLRVRSRLHRIDDALAAWQHEAASTRRSPHPHR